MLEGTVTSVHDYGAFVDIGGVEGLLHVSEISYQKIQSAEEALQPGQKLKVAIIRLDREAGKISLSLKALLADPWIVAGDKLAVGRELSGTVLQLKPFGAFVELFPGVIGLLHISRLGANRRVNHPKEILSVGQAVSVRILAVDTVRKTLSLTMEEPEEDFSGELSRLKEKQEEELKTGTSTMAALLDSAIQKRTKLILAQKRIPFFQPRSRIDQAHDLGGRFFNRFVGDVQDGPAASVRIDAGQKALRGGSARCRCNWNSGRLSSSTVVRQRIISRRWGLMVRAMIFF